MEVTQVEEASLVSLVNSLQLRVQELEAENAELSSRLSNCTCFEKEKKTHSKSGKSDSKSTKNKLQQKKPGYDTSVMNRQCKRYVALKVMYFGQRFYGFASEAQMDPTVESELFGALEKSRLLVGDKKESQYSRCGRTDKGVSSVGQVVALFLRSNLKKACSDHESSIEMVTREEYEGEIDYVRVLNRVLPNDIRVLGWCPVPIGFSARFSCLSREYKYFFWEESLNVLAMERAGKKFIGEHDFRNFCKMDAVNVHNYRRCITSFVITPCDVRLTLVDNCSDPNMLKSKSKLYVKVRCMVAVLFMIGQGFESPDVIDALLDIERSPRKPQYNMAPEIPLVLQSCEFENLKFTCSSDAGQALREHLAKQCQTYHLQAAIFKEALLTCFPVLSDKTTLNNGNGIIKKKVSHIPLMSRPTEPSYAERRAKLDSKA
ncbi:Pseudouridine synthase [Trema orientale]|uniref:tRNA pseudouridine synthase n=1 Tax=Trema orientale TaxID=63057 RepID=A0A2P5FRA0_TREOI|nr:Pseudouridine synthase [Trema orientale]